MNRRPLGAGGPLVSEIGLGALKLGRTEGLKYPAPFELPSDEEASRLLNTARQLGVNLIDVAPAYGVAEARLGRLLPGHRDDWIISTKAGETFQSGGSTFDFTPEGIALSMDASLRQLRVDHVDVLLAHSDGVIEKDLVGSGLLDALRHVQRAGKARLVGVSTKTLEGARMAVEHTDVVMVALSPVDTEADPAVTLAHERGVGVLVKKGLASGHLGKLGGDPVRAAVRFSLDRPGVSSLVIGTANPDHLAQAVAAAEADP